MNLLARLALAVALLAVALGGLVLVFQRRLLYFPARTTAPAAAALADRLGLRPWSDAAGEVRGWTAPLAGAPRARLLVLHGNAGSALDRAFYAAALAPRGLEVSLLEYPGYGARAGAPSEATLTAAALEAVDALAAAGPEPIWLLGESLGSGVASRAARLRPGRVAGLILVTPFARLAEVAHHHYPVLPGFLLRDRWAPRDDLAGFRGPVAVLIAGRDEVVTPGQGRALLDVPGGPRRGWEQPRAGHNSLDLRPGWAGWDEIVAFVGH